MKKFVIEREKLKENARIIEKKAGVPVFAVLKADGYGFGMKQMAEVLKETGIRMFAVTEPEDAQRLRDWGYTEEDILVMRSTAMADEAYQVVQANAIATVGSPEAAQCLNEVAQGCGMQAKRMSRLTRAWDATAFCRISMRRLKKCILRARAYR